MLIISILFNIYLVFCVFQMAASKMPKHISGVILIGQLIEQDFLGCYREENRGDLSGGKFMEREVFCGEGESFSFFGKVF